jgi:hypothetical protein
MARTCCEGGFGFFAKSGCYGQGLGLGLGLGLGRSSAAALSHNENHGVYLLRGRRRLREERVFGEGPLEVRVDLRRRRRPEANIYISDLCVEYRAATTSSSLERRIHSSRGDVFMDRKTNGINYRS